MRTRIIFLSVCLVMTTIAWAADINGQYQQDFLSRRDMALVWTADINGKWTAQVPGREGQPQETTFTFKVEGDKLTGTVGPARRYADCGRENHRRRNLFYRDA